MSRGRARQRHAARSESICSRCTHGRAGCLPSEGALCCAEGERLGRIQRRTARHRGGSGAADLLAFRGFTLLLAAPAAALLAAPFSGEPLLANWTHTFMRRRRGLHRQFFPLFLLGAVFGKLMDDSGAALSIARTITSTRWASRAP